MSVVEGQLHINGEAVENPEGLQMEHRVVFANQAEAQNAFRKLGLTKLDLGPVSAIPEGIAAVMASTETEVRAMNTAVSVELHEQRPQTGAPGNVPQRLGPRIQRVGPQQLGLSRCPKQAQRWS